MSTITKLKKWGPLFTTQFLGVLNDNLLKNLVCFIAIAWVSDPEDQTKILSLAGALLVLPFIFVSQYAGKLASMFEKTKILKWAKLMEIPIMLVGSAGFFFENLIISMSAIFLMGLQSALYSPSKYGLIRDVEGVKGVSFGNGVMELLSFVGILIGTTLAGLLSDLDHNQVSIIIVLLLSISVIGWFSSTMVKIEESDTEEGTQGGNPLSFLIENYKFAKEIKGLNYTVLGLASFWLVGSLLYFNILKYGPETYGYNNTETALLMAFVAIGIGLGCFVSGLFSKNRVELGLVPIGGIGLTISIFIICFIDISSVGFIACLMSGSFFSGFFKIPLSSWIQERVEGRKLGDILAYNNMVVSTFIVLSSIIFLIIEPMFGTQGVWLFMLATCLVMTTITVWHIPQLFARFVAYLLINTIYKINTSGLENVPRQSGALVVSNHLSLLDGAIVAATIPRAVRFVILKDVYNFWLLNWFFKRMNLIPVAHGGGKEGLEAFNKRCQEEINKGHIVCIFAEGQLSRVGNLMGFKKGIEHIGKGIDAPIIPFHMDNLEDAGLVYNVEKGKLSKPNIMNFKRLVTINIGSPLDSKTPSRIAREKVLELANLGMRNRIKEKTTISSLCLDQLKKNRTLFKDGNLTINSDQFQVRIKQYIKYTKEHFNKKDKICFQVDRCSDSYALFIALNHLNYTVHFVESLDTKNLDVFYKIIDCDYLENTINKVIQNNTDYYNLNYNKKSVGMHDSIAINVLNEGKTYTFTNEDIISNVLGLTQVFPIKKKKEICSLIPSNSVLDYTLFLFGLINNNIISFAPHESTEIMIGSSSKIEEELANNKHGSIETVIVNHEPLSDNLNKLIEKNKLELYQSIATPLFGVICINTPDYLGNDLVGRSFQQKGQLEAFHGRQVPGTAIRVIDEHGDSIIDKNEGQLQVKKDDQWIDTNLLANMNDEGFVQAT